MNRKTFISNHYSCIYLVGAGGTGAYLAQGLAKMIAGYKLDIGVSIIDPDVIEEKNCARQNFYHYEIGQSKAEALAMRLNQQYGVSFSGVCDYGEKVIDRPDYRGLIVTCVDSLKARKHYKDKGHWLDMGNGLSTGQAIFGTTCEQDQLFFQREFWEKHPTVDHLPNPFYVAKMNKLKEDKSIPSCADNPFTEQGVFTNEFAANAGLTILFQLLVKDQLSISRIYFDAEKGMMMPGYITREIFNDNR